MSASRHHHRPQQPLLVLPCSFLSPMSRGLQGSVAEPYPERDTRQSKWPRPCSQLNWHQEKVPSAGTEACASQALLVCHGNPGCNRDQCHSGREQETASTGRLFWHRVRHTLQSIMVKCLITDVVIKPEERCLYFFVFIAGNNKVPH